MTATRWPRIAGKLRAKPKGHAIALCSRCQARPVTGHLCSECARLRQVKGNLLGPDVMRRLGQLETLMSTRSRVTLPEEVVRALTAAGGDLAAAVPEGEIPFTTPAGLMLLDTPTGDGRTFEAAGFGFDTLPLPLQATTETAWGHDGAKNVGRIESITANGLAPIASGVFADTDDAREIVAHIFAGNLKSVSADLRILESVMNFTEDPDGFIIDAEFIATRFSVMGLTVLPFPGFEPCVITVDVGQPADAVPTTETVPGGRGTEDLSPNTANAPAAPTTPERIVVPIRASGGPVNPPLSAFHLPEPDELTPWTVSDDGRYGWGHLAPWPNGDGHTGCHIGAQDVCLCAEPSRAGYAYFLTGDMLCDDGSHIAVGSLTLSGGHAPDDGRRPLDEITAHYDNTDSAAAYLNVIDGELGVWACGVVRAGISDEDLQALRASSPSVHERDIAGNLELVRVCCVNTPGLPVLRASGGPLSDFPSPRARLDSDGRVVERIGATGAKRLATMKAKALAPPSRAEFDALRADLDVLLEPVKRAQALERIG